LIITKIIIEKEKIEPLIGLWGWSNFFKIIF